MRRDTFDGLALTLIEPTILSDVMWYAKPTYDIFMPIEDESGRVLLVDVGVREE